jgi:hypothetical protein
MTRLEALLYDLRHPINAIERTIACHYAKRFELILIERSDPNYLPNRVPL